MADPVTEIGKLVNRLGSCRDIAARIATDAEHLAETITTGPYAVHAAQVAHIAKHAATTTRGHAEAASHVISRAAHHRNQEATTR